MKKLYIIFLLAISLNAFAQAESNEIKISMLSPQPQFNYDTNATIDIVVLIRNNGPNDILSSDSVLYSLEINGDTSLYYAIKKEAGTYIPPNSTLVDTLFKSYAFPKTRNYEVCVSADGTVAYPLNTSKDRSDCVSFIVGVEEPKTQVQKLYYASSKVNFEFNRKVDAVVHIHDISGKEIYNSRINKKAGQLDFAVPASGFYFLRLVESNGNTTTSKFIVSNK